MHRREFSAKRRIQMRALSFLIGGFKLPVRGIVSRFFDAGLYEVHGAEKFEIAPVLALDSPLDLVQAENRYNP